MRSTPDRGALALGDRGVLGALEAVVRVEAKEVAEVVGVEGEGEGDGLHQVGGEDLELVHVLEDAGAEAREGVEGRDGPLVGALEACVISRSAGLERGERFLLGAELELLAVIDLVVGEFLAYIICKE